MIATFSYKKKLQLTGIASLLALLVCYRFAISNTIKERSLYKEQSASFLQMQHPATYLQQLQEKNEQIDLLFSQFSLDTLNPAKNLLAVVTDYCNNHKLEFKEYKPLGITQRENISILTRNVIVEGSFLDCLGLVYELETKRKTGRVSSVLFKSYTDIKDKRTKLACMLYIQNIITIQEPK